MAMGGFSGSDPAPSLDADPRPGRVRPAALRAARRDGGPGGPAASDVIDWVGSVGTVVNYGGSGGTLYDLSGAASGRS